MIRYCFVILTLLSSFYANAQFVYLVEGKGKNITNGQILEGKSSTVNVDIKGGKIIIDNHECIEIPMQDPTVRCVQDMVATRYTGRQTLYYYCVTGEMKRAVLFGNVPVINEMHLVSTATQPGTSTTNNNSVNNHSTSKQNAKKCLYTHTGDKLHCGGDGKCSVCGGDGLMDGFGINNIQCSQCHGTGKCISCNGTGYIK